MSYIYFLVGTIAGSLPGFPEDVIIEHRAGHPTNRILAKDPATGECYAITVERCEDAPPSIFTDPLPEGFHHHRPLAQ